MAVNANSAEVDVHGSIGGTKEMAAAGGGINMVKSLRENDSQLQGQVHQNVEQMQFDGAGGGIAGRNNTDEMEPGQMNQQLYIQQQRPPAVAASMQASHMPPSNILSDHISIGGKSQLH